MSMYLLLLGHHFFWANGQSAAYLKMDTLLCPEPPQWNSSDRGRRALKVGCSRVLYKLGVDSVKGLVLSLYVDKLL